MDNAAAVELTPAAPVLRLERRAGDERRAKKKKVKRESQPPREEAPRGPLGVVDQVRIALQPRSRAAFVVGLLLGAFVPLATYVTAHTELDWSRPLYEQGAAVFVAGGLLFSAVTMYAWGALAFFDRAKALGFVVLLEGTMVTSHTRWLALAALAYLVSINGVATACNLARGKKA